MESEFQCDVFLSHNAKDKAVVRPQAERLRQDGLTVWFDEWEIPVASVYDRRGDSRRSQSAATAAKIEEGLKGSWNSTPHSEFFLLRFFDAPIQSSLAQFPYINWCSSNRRKDYAKFFEFCVSPLDRN